MLETGAYVFIWLSFTLIHAWHNKPNTTQSVLPVFVGAIVPMQGILNVLIYSKKYQLIWCLFPCCCDPPQTPNQETSFNNKRNGSGNASFRRKSTARMNSTSRMRQLQERNLPWLSRLMQRQATPAPALAPQQRPPSSTGPPTEPGSSRAMAVKEQDPDISDLLHVSGFMTA